MYYHLKPGRITMRSLKDVDFDQVRYISIIKVDGGALMNKFEIRDYASLRLKIREDFSIKLMAKEESKQLR
jgi:hypothetical protein